MPPLMTEQAYFIWDGFLLGFTFEIILLYFGGHDAIAWKATLKCLNWVWEEDYWKIEKTWLAEVKLEKEEKLKLLEKELEKWSTLKSEIK